MNFSRFMGHSFPVLDTQDFSRVRSFVGAALLTHLNKRSPDSFDLLSSDLENICEIYSRELTDEFHNQSMSKRNRILSDDEVDHFERTSFFCWLNEVFEGIQISSQTGLSNREVNWRLTRPEQFTDVGPPHQDGWFWEANGWFSPSKKQVPVKAWIPLLYEPGVSGLAFWPREVGEEQGYEVIQADGIWKPRIIGAENLPDPRIFDGQARTCLLFLGNRLHQGRVGQKFCRVSIEFTFFASVSSVDRLQNEKMILA